jgi:hypothetical protein
MVLAFNPSTQEAEAVDLYEFKARLVYRGSSRTARGSFMSPCLKEREREREREKIYNTKIRTSVHYQETC